MYQFAYLAGVIAWLTGIVTCIKEDMVGMLILEIFLPPIGIVHGLLMWFS